MREIRVSVIIPVHNAAAFLRQCIDSVLAQSLTDIEVIIVNDGSSDASAEIIEACRAGDSRVRVYSHATQQGVSVARNLGLDQARGEFVIFIDADDYWNQSQMLENLYATVQAEQTDMLSFGFCRVDDSGNSSAIYRQPAASVELRTEQDWSIQYNIWAKLISRRLLQTCSIRFEAGLDIGEDALFSIALYCHAQKLVVIDSLYYCYRINPLGAIQMQWDQKKLHDSLRWFELAIPRVLNSPLFENRPQTLQALILERLRALDGRLGRLAFELLDEAQQTDFFERWAHCLRAFDVSPKNQQFHQSTDAKTLLELVRMIKQRQIDRLGEYFKDQADAERPGSVGQKVRLSKQQAAQIGSEILQLETPRIRCDFGQGVVVVLPRDRAHALARQLVDNVSSTVNLSFDTESSE